MRTRAAYWLFWSAVIVIGVVLALAKPLPVY